MTNDSKLPVVPGSKPAHGKPSSRQSPPCSRTERRPFVRDVSPLASRKQQEERVGRTSPFVARLPSRSATIPMRKKDLEMKTRSPRAVRKLEPLNHKPIPKSLEEGDATKSGIERVGYPLKKGSTLPAIQLSCPAIIVTDTDSMVGGCFCAARKQFSLWLWWCIASY